MDVTTYYDRDVRLITIMVFVTQAIFTFRTGFVFWFFAAVPTGQPVTQGWQRTIYALSYLFPAIVLTAAIAIELGRIGVTPIRQWLMENLAPFVVMSSFIVVGFLLVIRPDFMLRHTVRAHPDLADDYSVQQISRVIGVVMVAGSLFVLSRL